MFTKSYDTQYIDCDEQFSARNLEIALSTVVDWRTLGTNLGIPFDRLEQIGRDNYGMMSLAMVIRN